LFVSGFLWISYSGEEGKATNGLIPGVAEQGGRGPYKKISLIKLHYVSGLQGNQYEN